MEKAYSTDGLMATKNLVRTITVNTDIELEAYINILNEGGGVNF